MSKGDRSPKFTLTEYDRAVVRAGGTSLRHKIEYVLGCASAPMHAEDISAACDLLLQWDVVQIAFVCVRAGQVRASLEPRPGMREDAVVCVASALHADVREAAGARELTDDEQKMLRLERTRIEREVREVLARATAVDAGATNFVSTNAASADSGVCADGAGASADRTSVQAGAPQAAALDAGTPHRSAFSPVPGGGKKRGRSLRDGPLRGKVVAGPRQRGR